MNIDWAHFTPWGGVLGGGLIGLAVALLLLANGRVAGVSGIFANLLAARRGESGWRWAFVLGLVLAPLLWAVVVPGGLSPYRYSVSGFVGWTLLLLGGLLVGFGTRLSNGCTSGHGVCGLARFSPRSLAAVGIFMGSGFATVFLTRHLLGV